jgi:uncharacterized ion transporter superfamily protein YfcC
MPLSPSAPAAGVATPRPSRVPDTLVILAALALLAWLATQVALPGQFTLAGDPPRPVPGSFEAAGAPRPAPLFATDGRVGLLNLPFEGLVAGSRSSATIGLAAFLLILGGSFGIVMRTGAVDRALTGLLARPGRTPGEGLLVVLFFAFSAAGAVFGMGEEAIALTLVLTPALVRAGYDSPTAVAVCLGATQIGFATSWMNPFSVVVAQAIAGLPPLSGMGPRIALWLMLTVLGAAWLAWRARRVRHAPERSAAFLSDRMRHAAAGAGAGAGAGGLAQPLSRADGLILLAILATIVWVGWGVAARGWYLAEIAAQFLVLGLVAGGIALAARLLPEGLNGLAAAFRDGAVQMLPAVLVVAMAKGILLMLGGDNPGAPSLLNSLLDLGARATSALPDWLTAWGMLAIQSVLNLFIPSGSGQAAVTMPLMAPLADLSGVSRQTAVLAFQLGDGLTNLVIPTSAMLMGCLAAARLDFAIWLRVIALPMAGLMGLASAAVIAAQLLGWR